MLSDTGIRLTHREFGGRAVFGYNSVPGTTDTDTEGHGTFVTPQFFFIRFTLTAPSHVAGTIGSTTYGVAKRTTLVAVKVFDGSTGSASQVIAGFEWAANDIVSKERKDTAVINMSLGGRASTTWDAVITAAYAKGVLSVAASGNENRDAKDSSPARSPEIICVGNMQSNDAIYSGQFGSNYGSTVDILAPGTNVQSLSFASDSATTSKTGTSMASPHVAGLISYIRGLEGAMTAEAVKARVLALATPNKITGLRGEANLLAYNGNGR